MSLPDHDRLTQAEAAAVKCLEVMEGMIESVSLAKQVVAMRDDRMRKEESVLVAEFLNGGDSAAGARARAQADPRYAAAVKRIMSETAHAQQLLMKYELEKLKWENAQSLRNDERAKLRML